MIKFSGDKNAKKRQSSSGATVIETLIALSVFAIVIPLTAAMLYQANKVWNAISGDLGSTGQLYKAESWLRRDIELTAYSNNSFQTTGGPTSLSGKDGDAVWLLSAIDPELSPQRFVRREKDYSPPKSTKEADKKKGEPLWQRNILYYCVTPKNIDPNDFSGSGLAIDGYEVSCPYKVLVRKQINFKTSGNPSEPEQVLIPQNKISSYLDRPTGAVFAADKAEKIDVIATKLLSFRAKRLDNLQGIEVTLQAAKLKEAKREFAIGQKPLLDRRFLVEVKFLVFPSNH